MFSLFELENLCAEEEKLRDFLKQYGVLLDVEHCTCGGCLGQWCKTGSSSYRRCLVCRKKMYGRSSSVLENSKLSLKQWVYLAHHHHNQGEFVRNQRLWGKLRSVSTQGIDGTWGRLKTFLRSRGGISQDHLEASVKEFQWRRNLPPSDDPFLSLLCSIRDGCLH